MNANTTHAPASGQSARTLALVREHVRELLERSPAFRTLPPERQREIAGGTVRIAAYLAEPYGVRGDRLPIAFPRFVSKLVQGVFHAVVDASAQQMEAYGKLVAAVAASVDQFRDDNVSESQVRDSLTERFPETFPPNDGAVAVEEESVPSARTRLATSRQQLLATMVLMGINRIVVTDGRIRAGILS